MYSSEHLNLSKSIKEKKLRKLSKNSMKNKIIYPLKQNNVFIKISNENLANLFELSPENCEINKPILLKSLINHLITANKNDVIMKKKVLNNNGFNKNNNNINMLVHDPANPNENVFSLLYNKLNINTKNMFERDDNLNNNFNKFPTESFKSLFLNNESIINEKQHSSNCSVNMEETPIPNEEYSNKDSNTVFNVDKYFILNEDNTKVDSFYNKPHDLDANSFSNNILVSDYNNEEYCQKNENFSINDFFITSKL